MSSKRKWTICDVLRHLVPFVQFKKREKYPWRCVTFDKVAGLSLQLYLKYHSSMGAFHVFKFYKWFQMTQSVSYCFSSCKRLKTNLFKFLIYLNDILYISFVILLNLFKKWRNFPKNYQNSKNDIVALTYNTHDKCSPLSKGAVQNVCCENNPWTLEH